MENIIEKFQGVNPSGVPDIMSHITVNQAGTLVISDCMPYVGTYTFQFWHKARAKRTLKFYCGSTAALIESDTTWKYFTITFTEKDLYDIEISFPVGEFFIYNTKFEAYTVPTDWSPHPDDKTEAYDDIFNNINTQLIAHTEAITETSSKVDANTQEITNRVAKTTYETDMRGITNSLDKIQEGYDKWFVSVYNKYDFIDIDPDDGVDDREKNDISIFTLDNANVAPSLEVAVEDTPAGTSITPYYEKVFYYLTFVKMTNSGNITIPFTHGKCTLYLNGISKYSSTQTTKATNNVVFNFDQGWNVIEIVSNGQNVSFGTNISQLNTCEVFNCYMAVPTSRLIRTRSQFSNFNIYLDRIESSVGEQISEIWDDNGDIRETITNFQTDYEQTSQRFYWLVTENSQQSSLELTSSALQAIVNQFVVQSPGSNKRVVIEDGELKSDAVKSSNYVAGTSNPYYSQAGSFFDLLSGNIYTPTFYVDATNKKAYFKGDGEFSGKITTGSGEIGGFEITSTAIKTKNVAVTSNADNSISLSSADFTRTINDTSRAGLRFAIGDKFGVTGDGILYASSVVLSGTITAGSGSKIGPWNVTDSSIWKGAREALGVSGNNNIYLGNSGFSLGNKFVYDAGTGTLSINVTNFSVGSDSIGTMLDNAKTEATTAATAAAKTYTDNQITTNVTNWINGTYTSNLQSITNSLGDLQQSFNDRIDQWFIDTVPTTSNYPASQWNTSSLKESHVNDLCYDRSTGKVYQYSQVIGGVQITFSNDSETESINYDYIEIYFNYNNQLYKSSKFGGRGSSNTLAGLTFFIPSSTVYIYFKSDTSAVYYGFRVSNVVNTTGVFPPNVTKTNSLPTYSTSKTYTGVSTLPETDHLYANNVSELYTWNTNYSISTGVSYAWREIVDQDLVQAMTDISNTQAAVDGKASVFRTTPTDADAYQVGDMWVNANFTKNNKSYTNQIMVCIRNKASGVTHSIDYWDFASGYTDDSALNAFKELYTSQYNTLITQTDQKAQIYRQSSDPATDESWTTKEKADHVGDLWYNTSTSIWKSYNYSNNTYSWEEMKVNPPASLVTTINSKANVFIGSTTPTSPKTGDFWLKSANDDILTYVNNTWTKYNKYTDDSTFNTWKNDVYIPKIQDLEGVIDGKIDQWFIDAKPTLSNQPASAWTTTAIKDNHLGDICYDRSTGKLYQFNKKVYGAKIKFSSECKTESTNYDYVRVYFQYNNKWYVTTDKYGGTSSAAVTTLANLELFIPASKFYIYLHSDSSNTYYGFAITEVTRVQELFPDNITEVTGLPEVTFTKQTSYTGTSTLPESAHPYTNYAEELYTWDTQYSTSSSATYLWVEIVDQDIVDAMAAASHAQATADGKCTVFYNTPTTSDEYQKGDIWVNASVTINGKSLTNQIMRCATSKASGVAYKQSDWVLACGYTDDSALDNFKELYTSQYNTLLQQTDKKAEIYRQSSDPATWATADRSDHVGDLWYNTSTSVWKSYNYNSSNSTYSWEEMKVNPPAALVSTINGKANVFVGSTTPSNPKTGDLWMKSATDDIYTYVNSSWTKYNKYTDDTVANQAKQDAADAAKTATNYMNFITNFGLLISRSPYTSSNYTSRTGGNTVLTANGLDIYNGTSKLASYGSSMIFYKPGSNTRLMELTSSALNFYNTDGQKIASVGGGGLEIVNGSITLGTSGSSNYMYFGSSGLTLYNKLVYNTSNNSLTLNVDTLKIGNADYTDMVTTYANEVASEVAGEIAGQYAAGVNKGSSIYYATAIPTTSNYPYTSWTTASEKADHINDLCYVTSGANSGKIYRFVTTSKIKISLTYRTGSSADYFEMFYVDNGTTYRLNGDSSGKFYSSSSKDKDVVIPNGIFYIHWVSNSSSHNYYGVSINSITSTTDDLSSKTPGVALPQGKNGIIGITYNGTFHHGDPYADDENIVWKINPNVAADYGWEEIEDKLAKDAAETALLAKTHLYYNSTVGLVLHNGIYSIPDNVTASTLNNNITGGNIRITSSSMDIYNAGTKLASYGSTTHFYKSGTSTDAATLDSNGLNIKNGSISLGGKTSFTSTAAGFFVGPNSSGTYQMNVGNSSSYIKWDGSTLSMGFGGSSVATQSDVNSAVGEVQESISGIESNLEGYVDDAVADLVFIGENLLDMSMVKRNSGVTEEYSTAYEVRLKTTSSTGSWYIDSGAFPVNDQYYAIGFKFQKYSGTLSNIRITIGNLTLQSLTIDGTSHTTGTNFTLSNNTSSHTVVAVVQKTTTSSSKVNVYFNYNSSTEIVCDVWEIQVKQGKTLSDWKPSTADVKTAAADAADAAASAAETATNFITADSTGIYITKSKITSTSSRTGGNIRLDADGMTVYYGTTAYASYGSTTTIGQTNSNHITIDTTNGLQIKKGSASNSTLAKFTSSGITFYKAGTSTVAASLTTDGLIISNGSISLGSTPSSSTTGFSVSSAGALKASSATIYGSIFATGGTIGSINIGTNGIYSGSHSTYNSSNQGFYLGSNGSIGIGDANAYLRWNGDSKALTIKGHIEAPTGEIGLFNIYGGLLMATNPSIYIDPDTHITYNYYPYMSGDPDRGAFGVMEEHNGTETYHKTIDYDGNIMMDRTGIIRVGVGNAFNIEMKNYRILLNGSSYYSSEPQPEVTIADNYNSRWAKLVVTGVLTSSDERLKNNIKSVNNKYKELFMNIDTIEYESTKDDSIKYLGVGAQTLQRTLNKYDANELSIVDDSGEYLGVNYTQLLMLSVPIVQDHERRIIELESENNQLKQKVYQLEARINS